MPDANQSLRHYIDITQTAERALFDFVFNADSNSTFGPDDPEIWKRNTDAMRLEPLTLLGALSAVTQHIGLIATATTTYLDPFHVARMFATLDQLSRRPRRLERGDLVGGVGGVQLQPRQACARTPTATSAPPSSSQVAQGLWDTWEDDAFVLDKARGLFFDPTKMHMLNHKGEHFSVRGPLMMPRSPQGQPVIVQAGQSDAGRELAARTAEVLFTVAQDIEPARAFYADLKARVAQVRPLAGFDQDHAGRADGGRADAGTRRRKSSTRLQALIHPELGVPALSDIVGIDLSKYPARRADARRAADQHAAGPAEGGDGDGAAREPDHPPALQARGDRARPSRRARHREPTSPMRWRNGIAAAPPTASTSCRRCCRRA